MESIFISELRKIVLRIKRRTKDIFKKTNVFADTKFKRRVFTVKKRTTFKSFGEE